MSFRPTPFDYTSTRDYLADAYAYRKEKWAGFSHRYVAQKTGSSSGYFSRILSGALHLSESKLDDIAQLFMMSNEEREYFALLLRTELAEGEDKILMFRELLERRGIRLQVLEGEDFGLYGSWYLPVLREILALLPNQEWSDEEIGALLKPALPADLVAQGRSRLIELGLLLEAGVLGYKRSERMVSSGAKPQLALRHYADECLALARRALVEEELQNRELAFLTLSVSEKTQDMVVEKIRKLRRELLELAATELRPDRVMQVQVHFLPVSKPWEQR